MLKSAIENLCRALAANVIGHELPPQQLARLVPHIDEVISALNSHDFTPDASLIEPNAPQTFTLTEVELADLMAVMQEDASAPQPPNYALIAAHALAFIRQDLELLRQPIVAAAARLAAKLERGDAPAVAPSVTMAEVDALAEEAFRVGDNYKFMVHVLIPENAYQAREAVEFGESFEAKGGRWIMALPTMPITDQIPED